LNKTKTGKKTIERQSDKSCLNPERDSMTWKKRLTKELFWFAVIFSGSFLFWYVLSHIVDQHIIAKAFLYNREQHAFMITTGILYFLRLTAKL